MTAPDKQKFIAVHGQFMVDMARVEELAFAADQMPRFESEGAEVRSDMVRAAIVLCHAALEDLLRSLVELRLPFGSADVLQMIPMVGAEERPKPVFDLGDLAGHRDKAVSDVIRQSVVAYLSRTSYNSVGQVAQALDQMSLPRNLLGTHGRNLAAMMNRRHHIAHRADRNDGEGFGKGVYRTINPTTVSTWIMSVQRFGMVLIDAIDPDATGEGVVI